MTSCDRQLSCVEYSRCFPHGERWGVLPSGTVLPVLESVVVGQVVAIRTLSILRPGFSCWVNIVDGGKRSAWLDMSDDEYETLMRDGWAALDASDRRREAEMCDGRASCAQRLFE